MGNTHPRCTHAANFSTSQGQRFLSIFIIHMLFKNVMDIAITHVRLTVMLSPPHFLSIVGVLCTGPNACGIFKWRRRLCDFSLLSPLVLKKKRFCPSVGFARNMTSSYIFNRGCSYLTQQEITRFLPGHRPKRLKPMSGIFTSEGFVVTTFR